MAFTLAFDRRRPPSLRPSGPVPGTLAARPPFQPGRLFSCACGGVCPRCQSHHGASEVAAEQLAAGIERPPRQALPAGGRLPALSGAASAGGKPLDAATRQFMEPRLGHDLGQVRLHDDGVASASATALNASAYTVGSDIVFQQGLLAPQTAAGRRLLAHELAHVVQQHQAGRHWLARRVADPVADTRLQQVLLADLQAAPGQPCSAAAAYFQTNPPLASDPSLAHGPSTSLVEALLSAVRSVRAVFDGLKQPLARPAPGSGEMKLALSDVPGVAAAEMIDATALGYRLNIELLVPQAPDGSLGSAAVSSAIAAGRLSSIGLASHSEVRHATVTPVPMDGLTPCAPIPPDQIVWKRNAAGQLHIDAGGEGKHPEANNLNWTDKVYGAGGGPGLSTGDPIPNHVCGNIERSWPIGDRQADIISVHGSPIHPPEVARVIRDGGHISLTAGGMPQALAELVALLGPRIKTLDATPDVEHAERAEIDLKP